MYHSMVALFCFENDVDALSSLGMFDVPRFQASYVAEVGRVSAPAMGGKVSTLACTGEQEQVVHATAIPKDNKNRTPRFVAKRAPGVIGTKEISLSHG